MKTLTRKIVLSAAVLLLAVSALFSCQFPLVPPKDDGKVEYTRLVAAEGSVEVTELSEISSAIFNISGPVSVVTDKESPTDGEIVFGDADREITEKAKEKMDEQFKKDGAECGYIIYAEGKNVAVYWTNEDMKATALSLFLTECVNNSKLELKMGTVLCEGYTTSEYEKNKGWIALAAQGCDEEVISALKALNAFYDGSYMMGWFANLWDDEIGGFYFSNSARDNEPFLPDLESTYQLTGMLTSNGASSLSKNAFLPDEIKLKIINFVKRLQSAENGYFLHPQWPELSALKLDRYSRDLQWATDMLNSFTVDTDGDGKAERYYPNYCTPGSLKCEQHTKDGGRCDYSARTVSASYSVIADAASGGATVSLRESVSGAVRRVAKNSSAVVSVAVSSKPDFSSSAAFKQWVYDYSGGMEGFMANSGMKHELNAAQTEIWGKGFGDEMVEVLMEVQQYIWDYQAEYDMEQSGVWQLEADLGAVAGIHKYMPFLNQQNTALDIEMAKAMVKTCLKVITTPLDELKGGASSRPQLNDLMNMWTGLNSVISNVKSHNGSEAAEELHEIVRENAVPAIENSIANLSHYKLPKGLFAFDYSGVSLSIMYGCQASLGVPEADVNGTLMVTNMYKAVFSALNYDVVHLCTPVDGENFLRMIEGLDPIDKIPVQVGKTYDFEDDDTSFLTSTVYTSDYQAEIRQDPKDSSNSALYFKSGIPASGSTADTLKIRTTGAGGNCYIFETKVYFKSIGPTEDGAAFQISIGSLYMLTMGVSGGKIHFGYRTTNSNPTGVEANSSLVSVKNDDDWVKIRLEIYTADSTDDGKVKVKFFLNDEYVCTDDHYLSKHTGAAMNTGFTNVSFYSRYTFVTEIYLDDCFFNVESKMYDPEYHDISDSRD